MNPINSLPAVNPIQTSLPISQANLPTQAGGLDFQDLLLQSLKEVTGLQDTAEAGVQESLLQGDVTNIEVLTAVKKADLALRMMLQVRNKVLEAYDEIKQMRM
jgi:flagellar hook-basal body complex protein FliE